MKLMRKICALMAAAAMGTQLLPVTAGAYDWPQEFWEPNSAYTAALESKDNQGIITFGNQVLEVLSGRLGDSEVAGAYASCNYEVGFAYERMGDYINAAKHFAACIPYAKQVPEWGDMVKISENMVLQMTPRLEVYTLQEGQGKIYGAKNEPNGVLCGETSGTTQPEDSMTLVYLEYGDTSQFGWAGQKLKDAQADGRAVELALNFPGQGQQLPDIIMDFSFIERVIDLLLEYPQVPVYFRIGGEVDLWENRADSETFKLAFRKTASAVRSACPNVAIVWGVGHTPPWDVNRHDYYPGDEYVDWIGVSVYSNKYFLGQIQPENNRFGEVCFKTGNSSDPVLMLEDIVNTYGDRKPIMVSEGGAAYYTQGSVNESHPDWAMTHIRKQYGYLPMVYPQVKLIAYFNALQVNENSLYDLDSRPEIRQAYEEAVSASPVLIRSAYQNGVSKHFEKVENTITVKNGAVSLWSYAHIFGADEPTVTYSVNGQQLAVSRQIPYGVILDVSGLESGTYPLTVTAAGANGVTTEKTYTLTVENNQELELTQLQSQVIDEMLAKGLITGYEDGTVRPFNRLTRAEFTAMLCRYMGYSSAEPCTFSDAAAHWASGYIRACVDVGAINGMGGNLFMPENEITFEQAVKIVTILKGMTDGYDIDKLGGWPQAYLTIGGEKNLYRDMTQLIEQNILTRMDAMMLLYNAERG